MFNFNFSFIEFKLTQQLDDMRRFQLLFSIKKKDHPASTFSCGNNTTLLQNIDIDKLHSVLHEFRKRHYSAHRMTLVIQVSFSQTSICVKEYLFIFDICILGFIIIKHVGRSHQSKFF